MKYFTPELLSRFGSPDPKDASEAHEVLEQASDAYHVHLRGIQSKLPKSLGLLLDQFYLHDAEVFILGQPELENSFVICLQLGTPPHEELILTYHLAKEPEVVLHERLSEESPPFLEWLHDEVDVSVEGKQTVYTQSILLSNGRELILHFRDMEMVRISKTLYSVGKWQRDLLCQS